MVAYAREHQQAVSLWADARLGHSRTGAIVMLKPESLQVLSTRDRTTANKLVGRTVGLTFSRKVNWQRVNHSSSASLQCGSDASGSIASGGTMTSFFDKRQQDGRATTRALASSFRLPLLVFVRLIDGVSPPSVQMDRRRRRSFVGSDAVVRSVLTARGRQASRSRGTQSKREASDS